jgi:hypothetical protein
VNNNKKKYLYFINNKMFNYILLLLPVLSKLSTKTIPIKMIRPIIALILLYIGTIISIKYRCNKQTIKDAATKGLAPISIFIALTILSYVAKFVPIAPVKIASRILNNVLAWFLFGFAFRAIFNKMFDAEKC